MYKNYHIFFTILFLIVFSNSTYTQTSSLKLPTTDNTSRFNVLDNGSTNLFTVRGDGKIGIRQASPNATLEVGGLNGLLVTGTYASGTALSLGAGTRMHWYPKKAAFRVGYVNGTQWDDANIGNYSFATGYTTTASGDKSIAMGFSTSASGLVSIAMGYTTTASGKYSIAMGYSTTASGDYSTAMGYSTTASTNNSTAMGLSTTASGLASVAMGSHTTASGNYSTASGLYTTASGLYTTALGSYVSTNGKNGSFIIGDKSTTTIANSTALNQMMMRFNGGYKFYSNTALTTGVYMNSGINGWTNISDRNKKENFRTLDGELLLEKISAMPITEWNYKGTDKSVKYIGPMAQDFYAAFHLGGTDSLGINSIAIDGVNMAAIQSLINRTDELRNTQNELKIKTEEIEKLKLTVNKLQNNFNQLKKAFAILINKGSSDVKSKLAMNKYK